MTAAWEKRAASASSCRTNAAWLFWAGVLWRLFFTLAAQLSTAAFTSLNERPYRVAQSRR